MKIKIHVEETNYISLCENDEVPTVHFKDSLGASCSVRLDRTTTTRHFLYI